MKYCPNCGKELSESVTRCWNPECGLILPGPNKTEDMTIPRPKSDRLRELEMEYELATQGLIKGLPASIAAMLSGSLTILAAAVVLIMTGVELLSGSQLVVIIGILATAIIVYFAFVFGRAAKIKARIDKEKKEFEVEAGKKVR